MKLYRIYYSHYVANNSERTLGFCDSEHLVNMLHAVRARCGFTDEEMRDYINVEEINLNEVWECDYFPGRGC